MVRKFKLLKTHRRIYTVSFENKYNRKYDPNTFFTKYRHKLKSVLKRNVQLNKSIKFQTCLSVVFKKQLSDTSEIKYCQPWFVSDMMLINSKNRISYLLNKSYDQIISRFDCFIQYGSGWTLHRILSLDLNIVKIKRTLFGGNMTRNCHQTLPKCLKNKKAILNIQSPIGECFAYAIAACIKQIPGVRSPGRAHHYKSVISELKAIYTWMPINKVRYFERINNLRVNVFGWNLHDNKITVLYVTEMTRGVVCNIMLLDGHYFVVRDLSRLAPRSKSRNKTYICQKCLASFKNIRALGKHNLVCSLKGRQIFKASDPGSFIKFKNFRNTIPIRFVYYCDFETLLKTCNFTKGKKTKLNRKHVPVSFGVYRVCTNSAYNKGPFVYHGNEILDEFWKTLETDFDELQNISDIIYHPLHMSRAQKKSFKKSKHCKICRQKFSKNIRKVKDHCHITPHHNFRFALCNRCNLTYASVNITPVPVFIHNLCGFDSHLIIEQLKDREIKIIPKNSEKVLSFTVDKWRFIDSIAFLPASLQNLVDSLKQENDEMTTTFSHTRCIAKSDNQFKYLLRKNPYPYEYAQNLSDYNVVELPQKNSFFDSLKNEDISDDEYNYAKKVFHVFSCKSFLDYHLLYLKVDCTLLADVMENFRKLCLEVYELDPAYYVSSPQMAFDCFLRSSKVKLECLSDMTMIDYLYESIRGGISVVPTRYAKANNTYLEDFDRSKPSSYILYLDCVNLYGAAMKSKLPISNFRWMSDKEICDLSIDSLDPNGDNGYILEVDLDYPSAIHNITGDYPLAPEKISIKDEHLSPFSLKLKAKLNIPKQNERCTKLAPNVWNKRKYVVHLRNLQYYIAQGMKLRRIHRILQFRQKTWLSDFVDLNTQKRRDSKSDFRKLYFKLINNALYGKSLEDVRKRINMKLVTNKNTFDELVAKPNFSGVKVYNENLVGVTLQKVNVTLNKPIYAGFTILEISKLHMQQFYKNFTQHLYKPSQVKLLMSDTDSFLFHVTTKDIYKDLESISQTWLDTSNYPNNHPLYFSENRMVVGKFKDEIPPTEKNGYITEFCGLKSKLYSLKTTSQSCSFMRAKGVNRNALSGLNHSDYLECLHTCNKKDTTIQSIRSYDHRIFSITSRKSTMNPFDDKRYILSDNITTLPHGHFKIDYPSANIPVVIKLIKFLYVKHTLNSSKMTDGKDKRVFKLNDQKLLTVNTFQGNVYYHFRDTKKSKNLSFSYQEMLQLSHKFDKLIKIGQDFLKNIKKSEKSDSEASSSSSSDDDTRTKEVPRKKSKKIPVL